MLARGLWNGCGMATALENDPTFPASSEIEHPPSEGQYPASGEHGINSRYVIKRVWCLANFCSTVGVSGKSVKSRNDAKRRNEARKDSWKIRGIGDRAGN